MAFIRYKRPQIRRGDSKPRICAVITPAEAQETAWLMAHPDKQHGKLKQYCDNVLQVHGGESDGYREQPKRPANVPTAADYDKRYK